MKSLADDIFYSLISFLLHIGEELSGIVCEVVFSFMKGTIMYRFSKIVSVGSLMLLLMILIVGVVVAYFVSQSRSELTLLSTGELAIEVEQLSNGETSDWLPGESVQEQWRIVNTGSVPVYSKLKFSGEWDNGTLEGNKVGLTKFKIKKSSDIDWTEVNLADTSLDREIYISTSGEEIDLWSLEPTESISVEAEFKLDSSAGNQYQQANFELGLVADARQVTTDATWTE